MDHTVFVIKIPEFYPEAVCVLYIIIIIIIINMTQICSSRSTTDSLIKQKMRLTGRRSRHKNRRLCI